MLVSPQSDGGIVVTGDNFLPLADTPARVWFRTVERQGGRVDQTVLSCSTQVGQRWTGTGGEHSEMGPHLQ